MEPIKCETIYCRCGWFGYEAELIINKDIEQFHPRNRGRIFLSDPDYYEKAYYTTFELCPNCKRAIFGDGRPITLITKEVWEKLRGRLDK